MERIVNYLKAYDKEIDFLKMKYYAEAKWVLSTGLPFPDEAWELVRDEMLSRNGEIVLKNIYPVILTNEEAELIAKKLGVNDKAEDIRSEIISLKIPAKTDIKVSGLASNAGAMDCVLRGWIETE